METTERIVESYVRHVMGCATLPNVRCGGQNEIDLIAINLDTLARYHIEVSISISQGFSKLTGRPFDPVKVKERVHQAGQRRTVGFFVERKFNAPGVTERLREFGFEPGGYSRVIVTWGWTDDAEVQAQAAGIELWDFRQMVQSIAETLRDTRAYFSDDTLRTLHLFAAATEESERNPANRTARTVSAASNPNASPKYGAFWVYLNMPNNKALIHRGDCSHCNDGRGRGQGASDYNGQWLGPFDEAEARRAAARSGKKRIEWCGFCARKLGISPDDV